MMGKGMVLVASREYTEKKNEPHTSIEKSRDIEGSCKAGAAGRHAICGWGKVAGKGAGRQAGV